MKKVAVFTSTRADYGLLFHLLKALEEDPRCELSVLVTGTHLSARHGMTIDHIEKNFFKRIITFPVNVDGREEEVFSETLLKSSQIIQKEKFDICVVLGDRFEALAFGLASFMGNINLVHLHGGEITNGAKDDSYRHCLTKLSKLHFVAHPTYASRVIKMGEDPNSVFNVGPLGMEYLKSFRKMSKDELEEKFNFKFRPKNLLITFHPETHSFGLNEGYIKVLLKALETQKNCSLIFTMPNIDAEGEIIRKEISEFCKKNSEFAYCFENLGSINYLNIMSFVDGVVGNSSSGIYEAPYLKVPTLNLGSRQEGRIKATSVIDVEIERDAILKSLDQILANDYVLKNSEYPFGDVSAYINIKDIMLDFSFKKAKSFYE